MTTDASILTKPEETKKQASALKKLIATGIYNKTPFLYRTYGVKMTYGNEKIIQYLLEVRYEQYKKKMYHYRIDRKQLFKDGVELSNVMEKLAEESSRCLYPLHVAVNVTGEIVQVTNQHDIEKRWKEWQENLAKVYSGEPFEALCRAVAEAVSDPEQLLKKLQNDVGCKLIFSNIYMNYIQNFTLPGIFKRIRWFSALDPITFEGTQEMDQIVKENGRIYIRYCGTMIPTGGISQGSMKITYQLDAQNHSLLRLDGAFDYTLGEKPKQITCSAIWQKDKDLTRAREIEDLKRKGIYENPDDQSKWYEFWKW